MIVRRCEPDDLPDVIGLAATFHRESPVFRDLPFEAIKVHQLVSNAIENPDWLPLVAFAQGELVGMALFFALPSFFGPAIEAGDLAFYVRPDRRGTIAAGALMKRLFAWLAEKDVRLFRAGVNTGIDDARAEKFFAGCGLTRLGSVWALRPA